MIFKLVIAKGVRKEKVTKFLDGVIGQHKVKDIIKTEDGSRHMFVETFGNWQYIKDFCMVGTNNQSRSILDVGDTIQFYIITLVGATKQGVERELVKTLNSCDVVYKVEPVNDNGYLKFKVTIKLDDTFSKEKLDVILYRLKRVNHVGSVKWF